MSESASQGGSVVPLTGPYKYGLSVDLPENIARVVAEMIELERLGVAWVERSHPRYLELPAAIASIGVDRWYREALPHGLLAYREEEYIDGPSGEWVRWPIEWSRLEIGEIIDTNIRVRDRRLAAIIPLAWRVGFMVGWLSGVVSLQPDEAQAGMVLLAALVAPLLVSPGQVSTSLQLPAPGRKQGGKL